MIGAGGEGGRLPLRVEGPKFDPDACVSVVGQLAAQSNNLPTSRDVLERIVAGPMRGQLLAEVAGKFRHRSADEVEDALHEAYTRGLARCSWRSDREVYGWLRRVMVNWLVDRDRRERLELVVDTTSGAFLEVGDESAEPVHVLGRCQEREEVRDLHRAVVARLSGRQRHAVSLHAKGTERKEIARRLAASEEAIKKDLKRVFRVARDQVVVRSGHGCSDGEGLMIRYAFGLGGKAILAEAQLHLAHCEQCGRFFREIEAWRGKVAVLLPAVDQTGQGLLERTVEKATDVLAHVRQHALDGGAQLKQQAAASYHRSVDLSPLSGARPGATAAAIAACVAAASGATYCVEQGVKRFGPQPPPPHQRAAPKPEARVSQAPPPAVVPPQASEPPAQPVQVPEPSPEPPPPAPPPEPPPAQPPPPPPPEPTPPAVQFGEPATPAAPSASPPPAQAPAAPAPAPPNGGTDLYGP
jgi:RNA polymerase sigma factor (sigma-70 family)